MELTTEERRYFEEDSEKLKFPPSYHIRHRSITTIEIRKVIDEYIKRILLEVANKRGLTIPDSKFDIEEYLKRIQLPETFSNIDISCLKTPDKIDSYLKDKTKGMSSKELKRFIEVDMEEIRTSIFRVIHEEGYDYQAIEKSIDKLGSEIGFVSLNDEDWTEYEIEFVQHTFDGDTVECEKEKIKPHFRQEDISDEELIRFIRCMNINNDVEQYFSDFDRIITQYGYVVFNERKLNEFYSNKEFCKNLRRIMSHNRKTHRYYYHGAQGIIDAESILREGLGMYRKSIYTTACPEFDMDEVILYKYGMEEVGDEAIVIIDEPLKEGEESIVQPIAEGKVISGIPSGSQGYQEYRYIIDSKYIVGYINKADEEIVYNTRYYNYRKFSEKKDKKRPTSVPYSDERIAKGFLRIRDKVKRFFDRRGR